MLEVEMEWVKVSWNGSDGEDEQLTRKPQAHEIGSI